MGALLIQLVTLLICLLSPSLYTFTLVQSVKKGEKMARWLMMDGWLHNKLLCSALISGHTTVLTDTVLTDDLVQIKHQHDTSSTTSKTPISTKQQAYSLIRVELRLYQLTERQRD